MVVMTEKKQWSKKTKTDIEGGGGAWRRRKRKLRRKFDLKRRFSTQPKQRQRRKEIEN